MVAFAERSGLMRAVSVGGAALESLRRHREWVAIAVFCNSFYALDPSGGVTCFLNGKLEPGPLHVLCPAWPENLGALVRAGDVFRRSGERLSAPRLSVDLSGASAWFPAVSRRQGMPTAVVGVRRLLELLPAAAPGGSLVARLALGRQEERTGGDAVSRALVGAVEDGLHLISRWLTDPSPEATDAMFSLLGLGPGLTPSGDDILAGAALVLHGMDGRERESALFASRLPDFSGRTNRISYAHLRAAADGRCAAPFHDCLAAIFAGGGELPRVLPRVAAVGHGSGWDTLLGMLWVLRYFCGVSHPA